MCNRNGYIKFFRKIQDWEWYKDIPCKTLFLHCLLRANYGTQYFHGKKVEAGSFITTIRNLAEETGLTIQQVRTALNKLKITQELTTKSHSSNTVITINNWIDYQEDNTEPNNQITLIEEYKNKEYKNNTTTYIGTNVGQRKTKVFQKPTLEEIKSYCFERKNSINPSRFYDYYESNGWKVGKNSMKDWKAAVRTWEQKGEYNENKATKQTIKYRTV